VETNRRKDLSSPLLQRIVAEKVSATSGSRTVAAYIAVKPTVLAAFSVSMPLSVIHQIIARFDTSSKHARVQ